GHFITHPFGGQQTGFTVSQDQDTIVFTNNTYINNTSYFVFQGTKGQSKVGYMLFEHNTVFGSLVNTLMIDDMVNAHLNSNIFYAEAVFGNTDKSTANNWYTDNGDPLSTMFFSPTGFGVEADRILEVKNNTYFQPHYVIDYHAAYPEITTGVFMGPKTKAMFNDKAAYPLLSMSGNVDKDPKFKNIDVEDYVSEEIVFSAKTSYDSRTGTGWGVAPYRRNLDEDLTTVTDVAMFDWPLIEGNLEIEDESLITGGHDGLPVGNLNWNASKRSQYKYPNGVGGMLGLSMFGGPALSNDEVGFANKGYELSSFPNPAVETATITFKLPKKSNVIISVYNTMGQQIAVLANSSFAKGSHNVVWDASNVASGLYIYKLETEEVSQAHQIIITK
ncbi:MAG: T9SS type A sorting domain-containing protein, partial [Chlamydiia bacterium]|nr:T9SS type A sorting domain-containing protein [Chlamydiia bacterium]